MHAASAREARRIDRGFIGKRAGDMREATLGAVTRLVTGTRSACRALDESIHQASRKSLSGVDEGGLSTGTVLRVSWTEPTLLFCIQIWPPSLSPTTTALM